MIASPTRNSDVEHYLVCLEILEITIRLYTKATDKTFLGEQIKTQKEYLDKLKAKLDGHDYTAEERSIGTLKSGSNSYPHLLVKPLYFHQ